jgi:hypothetical protein
MKLSQADHRKLTRLLEDLASAVEELLLTGLTTASQATRQKLDVAFREASRMRLLRLGSTLRVANEELGRYVRKDEQFSRHRLMFFLNRAWLLSHGLVRALRENDTAEFERLLWTPASQPLERVDVVTLGVAKRVARGAYCAFEFRLRAVSDAPGIPAGHRLVWSSVFPVKPGVDIPPEGFLHLPQKQKFKASLFLEGKTMTIEKAAVALDDHGGGRISLGDTSTVSPGEPFSDWKSLATWSPQAALDRLRGYQPTPLDLEVDLQEEAVLDGWEIGKPEARESDHRIAYPIRCGTIELDALVSTGDEAKPLRKYLDSAAKAKTRPPLFGLLHYEMCRLVVEPLSVFGEQGPKHLTISDEKVDRKALLQALKF